MRNRGDGSMNKVNAKDCKPTQDFRTEEEKKLDREYDIKYAWKLKKFIYEQKREVLAKEKVIKKAEEEYSRMILKLVGRL